MRESSVTLAPADGGTESPVVELTNPNELFPPSFLPASSPFLIVGTATDDLGVARVEVDIVDRYTRLAWDQGAFVNFGIPVPQATILSDPGAQTTQFVFGPFDPELTGGTGVYEIVAHVTDIEGNVSSEDQLSGGTGSMLEVG